RRRIPYQQAYDRIRKGAATDELCLRWSCISRVSAGISQLLPGNRGTTTRFADLPPVGRGARGCLSAGSLLPTLRGREMPVARLWAVARRRPDLSLHRQDQAGTTPCFPEVPNLLARRNGAV